MRVRKSRANVRKSRAFGSRKPWPHLLRDVDVDVGERPQGEVGVELGALLPGAAAQRAARCASADSAQHLRPKKYSLLAAAIFQTTFVKGTAWQVTS